MDYKMIESNLDVILERIWLYAESFEAKNIKEFRDDIIKIIRKAEKEE